MNPKAATITASSASIAYFDAIPAVTPGYTGLVNGDTGAATPPTCSTTATQGSALGAYPSSCAGASDPNYTFSYVGGTVTIAKASATVTASNATITEGDSTPTITPSYSGLRNGQSTPATPATCSTTAGQFSSPGPYVSTCSGASDPNYNFTYVNGTVTVVAGPPTGYVAYSTIASVGSTTTTAAVSITSSVSATFTIPVASAPAWPAYSNLTVQTNNGPWPVFCKTISATSLGTCSSGGAVAQTIPAGALVTDDAYSAFDVYTIIPGGKTAVAPSSVTIVSDVPAVDRQIPSVVKADANFGLIEYMQAGAPPTGTFSLTFGYCDTGTTTYSASNPACHTGFIKYGPTVISTMGMQVTVTIITENLYEKVGTYAVAPTSIPTGTTFTSYVAPAAAQIPRLQSSPVGDVTVNSGKSYLAIVPVPNGMTSSARVGHRW